MDCIHVCHYCVSHAKHITGHETAQQEGLEIVGSKVAIDMNLEKVQKDKSSVALLFLVLTKKGKKATENVLYYS